MAESLTFLSKCMTVHTTIGTVSVWYYPQKYSIVLLTGF